VTARRTGRRPGKQDTREAILATARTSFAEGGYDGTSIRQIASGAGVDPALVHHYFGTKDALFLAVVRPPFDPAQLMAQIYGDGADGLPERLVRTFLSMWEAPVSGPAMKSLIRGGVAHGPTGRLLKEFFSRQIVRNLRRVLAVEVPPDELPLRASLVASQLFGLAVTRYVLEFEPLAGAPVESVVSATAPTIERYLFGELS